MNVKHFDKKILKRPMENTCPCLYILLHNELLANQNTIYTISFRETNEWIDNNIKVNCLSSKNKSQLIRVEKQMLYAKW